MATLPNPNSWRDLPITDKQKGYIDYLWRNTDAPTFTGTTRGEACDYIKKFRGQANYIHDEEFEYELNYWLDIEDTY